MQQVRKLMFAALLGLFLTLQSLGVDAQSLIPGGEAVGLNLQFRGVCITEVEKDGPADRAGLKAGDCIRSVNETQISSTDALAAQIAASSSLRVAVDRSGKQMSFTVYPEKTPDGSVIGVKVMDSISGIGTLTYYDPQDNTVGVLGHGVNLPAKAAQPVLSGGSFYYTEIVDVQKSQRGDPGELKGSADDPRAAGEIKENTANGLFGEATTPDKSMQPIPTADISMIHPGNAVIRCCVSGTQVQEYSVQIVKVYPQSVNGRDLLLQVTDPALLAQTGGIVRGMSGSPIIQDGRLVGAVTHVLVDDPTRGYGIFIKSMLDAAEMAA